MPLGWTQQKYLQQDQASREWMKKGSRDADPTNKNAKDLLALFEQWDTAAPQPTEGGGGGDGGGGGGGPMAAPPGPLGGGGGGGAQAPMAGLQLAAPSMLRSGLGQRNPPPLYNALAGLRRIY